MKQMVADNEASRAESKITLKGGPGDGYSFSIPNGTNTLELTLDVDGHREPVTYNRVGGTNDFEHVGE